MTPDMEGVAGPVTVASKTGDNCHQGCIHCNLSYLHRVGSSKTHRHPLKGSHMSPWTTGLHEIPWNRPPNTKKWPYIGHMDLSCIQLIEMCPQCVSCVCWNTFRSR